MPKVAQYQGNQVLTEVVSQPRADASAGARVFDSNIRAAQGVNALAQSFGDMQERLDTAAAEEALVSFERDKNSIFFDPDNGYFNTQGRDAYDMAESARKSLQDLQKTYGEGLSSSAKALFDKAASAHMTRSQVDIDRHASKGLDAWEIANINAQVENTIESASLYWNQPDRLRVQNALGRQSVIDAAEREGLSPEVTNERLQTYDSSFSKSAIEAALLSSSKDGQEAFDSMSSRLEGPDRLKLEKNIQAKREAEETQLQAQQAIILGTQMSDRFESREEIRDEVNAIEDPELRKKTMTEAMRQFNLKKQAKSEAQAEAFERAESHIIDGGSAETYKAEDPEGWARLSSKQKKNIESGKAVITDWNVFSDLMVMPREELAKVNPVDHFDKLGVSERSKLVSAVRSANGTGSSSEKTDNQVGRTRTSQTTAALEEVLGKKSKWNADKRQTANAFYSVLDEEVAFREAQKEGSLSSEEFTRVLSDLTRKATIERSFLGVDILVPDTEQDVADVPPEELKEVTRFMRDNGIPVTSDNILKVHREASR